jgi:hypothetical protein
MPSPAATPFPTSSGWCPAGTAAGARAACRFLCHRRFEFAKLDGCDKPNTISRRLAELPRAAFDYVWIIDTDRVRPVAGAVAVRRTPGSVLYRIVR